MNTKLTTSTVQEIQTSDVSTVLDHYVGLGREGSLSDEMGM